jgi:hypothetical protein
LINVNDSYWSQKRERREKEEKLAWTYDANADPLVVVVKEAEARWIFSADVM